MQHQEGGAGHAIRTILTRDFILGFLTLFTFIAASYTLIPTLPVYLQRLGSNATEIGVLVGAFAASSLVCRLLVGGALRRYAEKAVIMFGAVLLAVTFLTFILLRPFWPVFVIRVLQGVAFACVDTAALAFVINVIPPAYRGQSIGYIVVAPNVAMAFAPLSGMAIINRYGFLVLFLTGAGLSLCALLLASKLKGGQAAKPGGETHGGKGGLLERRIVAPAITAFMHNCLWGALISFLPLYALNCGIANPGHFFTASAVMLIGGRSVGGRILDVYSKEKIILAVIAIGMTAMVLLSFSRTLPMLVVVGLLFGISSAFLYPASMAYAFEHAGTSGGTAVGTMRALMDLGIALGPVIAGIILRLTSYQTMFLSLALLCLINLAYFQFYVRKRR